MTQTPNEPQRPTAGFPMFLQLWFKGPPGGLIPNNFGGDTMCQLSEIKEKSFMTGKMGIENHRGARFGPRRGTNKMKPTLNRWGIE